MYQVTNKRIIEEESIYLLQQLNDIDIVRSQMYNIIERTIPFSDEQEYQVINYVEFLLEYQIIFDININNVNFVDICYYYCRNERY